MANYYSVTAPSERMVVKDNGGEMTFTVTNTTDRSLQTRFDVRIDAPAKPEWVQVDDPQRLIPAHGTEQVPVKLKAPPEAEGASVLRIVAVSLERPDEDFTPGPAVGLTLAKKAAPVVNGGTKIPWWVFLIIGVVVLAVVGTILYFVLRDDGGTVIKKVEPSALVAVPSVEGMPVDKAAAKLKESGLEAGARVPTAEGSGPAGTVVRQNPKARPEPFAARGSKVDLYVKQ